MCRNNLPGSALATHDVTNDYHGVSEKMVYRRMYDETADMTFYVDRDYKVVEFFESWIDYITGVNDRNLFENPYVNHRVAYANNYKVNFYLTKFEKICTIMDPVELWIILLFMDFQLLSPQCQFLMIKVKF